MITTYYNEADIDHAIQEIWADGHVPIMYTSEKNVNDLVLRYAIDTIKSNHAGIIHTGDSFCGKDRGCYIYKTNKVGDLYVIVPMPFRSIEINEKDD